LAQETYRRVRRARSGWPGDSDSLRAFHAALKRPGPMKPSAFLAAFAASFLVWLPRCEAALRTVSQQGLLLRRLRQQRAGTEPFIVSFRVSFEDGFDNVELAKNLTRKINTPGDPIAGLMGYSVARVFNGTFPPVQWPPSTTNPKMGAVPTTPPPQAQAMYAPVAVATTPKPTAIQTALEALRISRENRQTYEALTKRMTDATAAHADALVFGNPSGTTPLPTEAPTLQNMKKRSAVPHTLGRLIYDAFVNTPKPIEITTPMPTPAVPVHAVLESATTANPDFLR